jgi:hypothetical protein
MTSQFGYYRSGETRRAWLTELSRKQCKPIRTTQVEFCEELCNVSVACLEIRLADECLDDSKGKRQ